MSKGKSLRVHGLVSSRFMRNINELQMAWCCWKPEVYKLIDIIPDRVVNVTRSTSDKVISAFSGGVDATFTALRHAHAVNYTRYPLTDVLMVHGFDVALKNTAAFDRLLSRVEPLLSDLKLSRWIVRTNTKDVLDISWEDSFAAQLAGCLHMLSHDFGYSLIGSSEPYDAMVFPWGSTPATDYLMSGDQMTVVHDGASFSRTQKSAEILKSPIACKTLKVCWSGEDQGTNCGVCEKCIRTKLNFLAAGNASPECFSELLDISTIGSLVISNKAQLAELEGIARFAKARHLVCEWLPLLEKRIARGINTYEPSFAKRAIITTLDIVGLKEPAKKYWRVLLQQTGGT